MAESFLSSKRFFDNKNYPRGFSRHGDFTIKESQILEKFGNAFLELENGTRKAKTDLEKSFVEVCKKSKKASNEYEKVWEKYHLCINKAKKFHTLSGGKPQLDGSEDFNDNDD